MTTGVCACICIVTSRSSQGQGNLALAFVTFLSLVRIIGMTEQEKSIIEQLIRYKFLYNSTMLNIMGAMTERERVIAMTDEEARAWMYEAPVNSHEFIRRHNVIYFDCGLTRVGIDVTRPIKTGELICTYE